MRRNGYDWFSLEKFADQKAGFYIGLAKKIDAGPSFVAFIFCGKYIFDEKKRCGIRRY